MNSFSAGIAVGLVAGAVLTYFVSWLMCYFYPEMS
jgi:hypothetical protein